MSVVNNTITHNTEEIFSPVSKPETAALLSGYEEICKSYHAIDDFRMKLLGLLPLASLIGIFGLSNESLFAQLTPMSHELITFIGIFAATFTLALFIFEIRGILRCNGLIQKGRDIESLLKIKGQFFLCNEEHECKKVKPWKENFINFFDAKLAACVIYSTVFAAWLFTVLRFGFSGSIYGCAFSALGIGLVMGGSAFYLVKKLIAA
jgi:hypothetical protein